MTVTPDPNAQPAVKTAQAAPKEPKHDGSLYEDSVSSRTPEETHAAFMSQIADKWKAEHGPSLGNITDQYEELTDQVPVSDPIVPDEPVMVDSFEVYDARMTVAQAKEWVGTDLERAELVLEVEEAREDGGRKTLIDWLYELIGA